jgi:hypothetical protein
MLLPVSLLLMNCASLQGQTIHTGFFYGDKIPQQRLLEQGVDRLVLEADNLLAADTPAALERFRRGGVEVFAYVSVGEAEGWRGMTRQLDARLFIGENPAWNSRVADLSHPGWANYLIEQRMAGLWQLGYRAFFLDTLDSYQIILPDASAQAEQLRALGQLVKAMHVRFPGVRLLLNRGFDALPEIGPLAVGLVAESLFRGWDAQAKQYVEVSRADQLWLVARLRDASKRYRLPVTVIDYVDAGEPVLAQQTARRIEALGFSAWIGNPALDILPQAAP